MLRVRVKRLLSIFFAFACITMADVSDAAQTCDLQKEVQTVLNAIGNDPAQTLSESLKTILQLEAKPEDAAALEKAYPKNFPFQKLVAQKKLTPTEINEVVEQVLKIKALPPFDTQEKFYTYFRNEVIIPYLQANLDASSIEGLAKASELVSHPAMGYETAQEIVSRIPGRITPAQKTYHDILEVFDLLDISRMVKGASASEPLTLDVMKKSAAEFIATEKQLDGLKNAQFKDITAAMKDILGQKAVYRDDSVVMGPNDKTRSYYIHTSVEAADDLSKNGLLTTKVLKSPSTPSDARVYVEYPNEQNYPRFEHLLSPELRKDLEHQRANASEATVEALNKRITSELTESLLNPKKVHNIVGTMKGLKPEELPGFQNTEIKPLDLYRTLVSIHPLGDGNGRLSRLFFEYIAKDVHWRGRRFKMDSPVFDMDLFGSESQMANFLALEPAFSRWISNAKTDKEFFNRSTQALKYLVKTHPELKITFPELANEGVDTGTK